MPEDIAFTIAVYAMTDVGLVRQGNEDNFLVLNLSTADTWNSETEGDPDERLTTFTQSAYGSVLAVTDGMGGALAGEVASGMAVEAVRDRLLEVQSSPIYSKFPFYERLRLSIELANQEIYEASVNRRECAGMGATFTAIGLHGTSAYFAQVGDSRAYIIRDNQIQQITRDQSLVGQLVRSGHITEEEAERHTYKNVILQALGAAARVNVVVDKLHLNDLDIVVLCSDGLTNKVRADEIKQIVDESPSLKEACEELIKLANQRGGDDNITVVVAQFTGNQFASAQSINSGAWATTSGTIPLASDTAQEAVNATAPMERWGAVTIPRHPELPMEIDLKDLYEEEETLRPTEPVTDKSKR